MIEVWLTEKTIGIKCMVIHEDESGEYPELKSITMRGAMREATRRFGKPVGRWKKEHTQEFVRVFE